MSKNGITKNPGSWRRTVELFLKRLESPKRLRVIERYNGRLVSVTQSTPLGLVELHHDWGHCIGPRFVLITMLGEEKVAVPYAYSEDADYICRPLSLEPVCYGKWFPFSLLEGDRMDDLSSSKVGMIARGGRTWKFRCYAPDGSLAWVPVPEGFADADCPSHP